MLIAYPTLRAVCIAVPPHLHDPSITARYGPFVTRQHNSKPSARAGACLGNGKRRGQRRLALLAILVMGPVWAVVHFYLGR